MFADTVDEAGGAGKPIDEAQVVSFLQDDEDLKRHIRERRARMEKLERERLASLPPIVVVTPPPAAKPALKPWEKPKVYGPGMPYPGQSQPQRPVDPWDQIEARNRQELERQLALDS